MKKKKKTEAKYIWAGTGEMLKCLRVPTAIAET